MTKAIGLSMLVLKVIESLLLPKGDLITSVPQQ